MSNKFAFSVSIFFLTSILFSCSKNYNYLYKKDILSDSAIVYIQNYDNFVLKPGNILHINIISNNEDINKQFRTEKQDNQNFASTRNSAGFYLTGYTLDTDYNIEIPVLGKINLKEKTVAQARQIITEKTNTVISNAIVNVKLVSYKISMIGEFNSQGEILIFQEKANILQAIALAGGTTQYADLRNIKIVRETAGQTKIMNIDITKPEAVESKFFTVYPDDLIIADSRKSKSLKMNAQEYTTLLSAITTSVSTILLILQLKKSN